MNNEQSQDNQILWLEWLALIAIIVLATFLRYWRIEEVPPGFNSDEAVGAVGALTTLREGFKFSYEGQGGGGVLGFYFAAASFYLFGPSIAAIRGLAAWAGVVGLFANYWAIREMFRTIDINQARWLAGLSTLGLTLSWWHLSVSRIAFAGIGVPFLMLPSVYFLWLGLNSYESKQRWWPFALSGIFLGGLMYIYLSGVFVPPLYAAFFIAQWLIFRWTQRLGLTAIPNRAYMTTQFWRIFVTAAIGVVLLIPLVYVVLTRPDAEPGAVRASQAFFLNPMIHQGDPWGLLWRSIVGNFGAYGVSLTWLWGESPPLLTLPWQVGLMVFTGFIIALWRSIRGQAAYQFLVLWLVMLLLPSILSPDAIPHNLRTIGATTPVFVLAAIPVVVVIDILSRIGRHWLPPHQPAHFWLTRGVSVALALGLLWLVWRVNMPQLYYYFNVFPETNDAQAAFHVYAVEMAEEINREERSEVAFILPRNTAAGDVFRNFTTDFLVDLEQPPASHYWVVDDEATLPADLTQAAADHDIIRVVRWKTSKHTGADPKEIIPYYLEKYGHYESTATFEYFDIDTYRLEATAPDFAAAEKLTPTAVDFGGQIQLTGYALGDAGQPATVASAEASSGDLLWLRLGWQKTADHPDDLKVSALIYNQSGQLVTQIDKVLVNNIVQQASREWPLGETAATYFLLPIPPATPPGEYTLRLAVYGNESLLRLPVLSPDAPEGAAGLVTLTEFTVTPAETPPALDDLNLALEVGQPLMPGLTLVGFETLPGTTVRAGEQVGASLIWQAGEESRPTEVQMSLSVKPEAGDDEIFVSEPAGLAGDYPTDDWQSGEVLRGWLSARIPPTFEPGLYKLRLTLSSPNSDPLVLPIGDFEVEGWPRNFDAPTPQIALDADFNGQAVLVGLDTESRMLQPGADLPVRAYWQVAAEFAENYTAFVHLVGPDGTLYGQVDQIPGAGAYPTTGWLSGEYITDEYLIPVSQDAPPGAYQLAIGMYNPNTGERLPLDSAACAEGVCLPTADSLMVTGFVVE